MIQPNKENPVKPPEFKPEYIRAFLGLCLHKLGGFQTIPLELLEKHPVESDIIVGWDEDKKAFTLKVPMPEQNKVQVPKGIKRKRKRIIY